MKVSTIALFLTLALTLAASAQSGRKSKIATPAPAAQQTDATTPDTSDGSVGYSESAPNAGHSIAVDRTDRKTRKAAKKANEAKPADTAALPATAPDGSEDVVKVETSLVTIPVSVYDRNGLYISNLHQANFKIFEDGVEQKVDYFGTTDKPFSVILLIDVSPSTAYKIEEIQAAAAAFVSQLMPQDSVMVIEFDSSVHVLAEMTADRDKIDKAIRRTGFGGGTSLYEAVDFSLRRRLDKIEGRKAIVLFTDGVDTSSMRASYESTIREAEETEAVVFPVYYNTFLNAIGIGGGGGVMSTTPTLNIPGMGGQSNASLSADYTRGRAYLTELAATTGGSVFRAESTPGGLNAAFEGIAEELRRQYSIGYSPLEPGKPGERRQIRVRVDRPHLVIRSRDSYIVGSNAKGS